MRHTKELYSLEGKVAIVTGGRGLYGSSISASLCEMGATVVIASRNGKACDTYAQALRDQGYKAVGRNPTWNGRTAGVLYIPSKNPILEGSPPPI